MASDGPAEHLEQELAVLLRRANGISGQLARELHPDLEPGAYGLMLRVALEGGARATDLAAYLGIGRPTISRQLATLERLGLIKRSRDPEDARAHVVSLTDAGTAQVEQVRAARRTHVHQMLTGWSDDDVELLASLLDQLNRTLAQGPVEDTTRGD